FVLVHLMIGKLIRPARPSAEKMTIYECGEPTIGSAWIQFDLRFYVIALLFVVFDVEVAFFFPCAVVFGQSNNVANTTLPLEQQVQAYLDLTPDTPATHATRQNILDALQKGDRDAVERELAGVRAPARGLAWLAFWAILVVFGVLL